MLDPNQSAIAATTAAKRSSSRIEKRSDTPRGSRTLRTSTSTRTSATQSATKYQNAHQGMLLETEYHMKAYRRVCACSSGSQACTATTSHRTVLPEPRPSLASDRHRPADRGEEHQPLANRHPEGLGEAAAVELELRRVVRGLGEGLLGGDRVRLVVHDHELAVLLEDEVDDPLDEVRGVGEGEAQLAPDPARAARAVEHGKAEHPLRLRGGAAGGLGIEPEGGGE